MSKSRDPLPPDPPRETLRILRDDPRIAIERLRARIAASEADYRTWHNLAVALAKSGDLDGAFDAVARALEERPDSAVSHFLHGMLLKGADRFDESLAAFERVAEIDPDRPRLHANRGVVHFFLGDESSAEADLQEATRRNRADTVSLFNLAVVSVSRKHYRQAQALFEKLIEAEPERADYYQRFLVELGRAEAIEETFSQAHRIKNFMGIVGDRLRRFCDDGPRQLDTEAQEDLDAIRDDYERIYSDLVVFLGAIRPRSLELERSDLRRLLQRVIFVAGGRADGVAIVSELAEDLPSVECDVEQLQEAFLNLLLNGIEACRAAMERGREGESSADGGKIRIEAAPERSGVRVSFVDNGVGIPAGELNRVFQFGFTTKTLGSGIGLAHTRRIVRDHGGDITVQSCEGEGTSVHCWLPLEAPVGESLSSLSVRSQLLEDPRELILEEEGEDLGI